MRHQDTALGYGDIGRMQLQKLQAGLQNSIDDSGWPGAANAMRYGCRYASW
ncbi:hypothetical protein GEM_4435 [Burkholderia cepacia GG4]|uniref:Uncharacterized protein n=1 Tax=Burkholderia cepacia GG4 TaxID=1009846 RepID=A0A9W3K602_BURCE|nr:hypothetical protein GEM_4435 [Burkholderia cepacia GG4]